MSANPIRAREIFIAALKLAPEQRDSYLSEACRDDAALGGRVRDLLAAHSAAGSFLDPTAAVAIAGDPAPGDGPGTIIEAYKLLEEIGEGGFGVVFMAEQLQPVRRKVALKILKAGMDTRQVVARFEAERQALALMSHPNIAQVLDGGETASGRPYFVMELVRGIPITDFCDREQLPVRARLELFVTICQAVQHAHQKGIIHRDLKPSNVLVTLHDEKPVPKVIDFGIAKATGQQLTDKTLFTNFTQLIGTPLYMSPEQAQMSGLDIDTRTDIYSLGVVLYELLTGTTPFDKERLLTEPVDEMRRIIREEEPARPSLRISTLGDAASTISVNRQSDPRRLSRLFRRELDWIVMKCLDKDRNRRYATAHGLAMDVLRYLKDEPVQACPPSLGYRLRKFTGRHKGPLTTTAFLAATLVLGSVVSLWQAVRATQAKDAEAGARLDLEIARHLAEERADRIARDLEQLSAANGWIDNGRYHADIGEWAKAEHAYRKAVECRPDNSHAWNARAEFYVRLGLWDLAAADVARAVELHEPGSPHSWYLHALLRLSVGDMNGYRQACRRMYDRFGAAADAAASHTLARALLLSTDPEIPAEELVRLAEQALTPRRTPWHLTSLATAHYRAGQFEEALRGIAESRSREPGIRISNACGTNPLPRWLASALAGARRPASIWPLPPKPSTSGSNRCTRTSRASCRHTGGMFWKAACTIARRPC